VPEVKIGCEPGIGHVPIMKDRLPGRLLSCSRKDCNDSLPRRSCCQPGWTRNMSAISRLVIVNIFPVRNYIDMATFNEEQRSTWFSHSERAPVRLAGSSRMSSKACAQ
jgi:hypothetical protein